MAPIDSIMPLAAFRTWSPFHIDALGLVTLIGADSVNTSVGRLVNSRYTTFLPLLGAYLIASNQFTEASSGYTLFNLTDYIRTDSISGWFSRWLDCQDLANSTTTFRWSVLPAARNSSWRRHIAPLIGFLVFGPLFALTVLMGDWWGVGNTAAMAVSVLVRWFLVRENSMGLDHACYEACYGKDSTKLLQEVRILMTLANGKLITILAPRGLVIRGFTRKPNLSNLTAVKLVTAVGWFAFGVHVLALGQSALLSQIYSVILLVGSTWLTVHGFGDNEMEIGRHLSVEKIEHLESVPDRNMWAYAKLEPTEDEEESMVFWGLLPRKTNVGWWEEYQEAKATWLAFQVQRERRYSCLKKEQSFDSNCSSMSLG